MVARVDKDFEGQTEKDVPKPAILEKRNCNIVHHSAGHNAKVEDESFERRNCHLQKANEKRMQLGLYILQGVHFSVACKHHQTGTGYENREFSVHTGLWTWGRTNAKDRDRF